MYLDIFYDMICMFPYILYVVCVLLITSDICVKRF